MADFDWDTDGFGPIEPVKESPRDRCIRRLSALRKGDTVTIGKSRWDVWRNTGVSNLVIKAGTKGRKLYAIRTTEIERCCVEVVEVSPGSGEPLGKKAVAKGCSVTDTTWAGHQRVPRRMLHGQLGVKPKRTKAALQKEMAHYIKSLGLPKPTKIEIDDFWWDDEDINSVKVRGAWKLPSTGWASIGAYYRKGDDRFELDRAEGTISWMRLPKSAATKLKAAGVKFTEPLKVGDTWQLLSQSHRLGAKEFAQKVIGPFMKGK